MTPLRAQTVVVMVNGDPITNYDIDQRSKLNVISTHKPAVRQQVIDELIDEKLKIKEGKKFGVEPNASDVDQSYASVGTRMRLSPDQLTKTLEAQGIRPETFKERLKAEMVWSSIVRGRFKESLQISERDVTAALQSGGDAKEADSFEYKMQPLVLIVPRGSAASAIEARRKEAEALRSRVQTCAEANGVFRSLQGAAIREIVVRTSADLPPALRQVLDNTPIGHLTPPEVTKQGIEMVALCGRNPATGDTPKKKEIREKLYTQKYEAKSKSYLQDIRKAAMIEFR